MDLCNVIFPMKQILSIESNTKCQIFKSICRLSAVGNDSNSQTTRAEDHAPPPELEPLEPLVGSVALCLHMKR